MQFGTRAAGACFTHFPEVIFRSVTADVTRVDTGFRLPQLECFIILKENSSIEPGGIQTVHPCQQVPCPVYRLRLEIIAERPVSEHLEHGVVNRAGPHFFQVVMLSRNPDTFLAVHRPIVLAFTGSQEYILELVHPRIDKEQGWIVQGHDRGGRNEFMWRIFYLLKIVDELFTDLG